MLEKAWRAEPVKCATYVAAAIVFIAAKAGVVVDQQSLIDALLLVVPIVLAGHSARHEVIPVHSLVTDHTRLPPDPVNQPEPPKPARKRKSA